MFVFKLQKVHSFKCQKKLNMFTNITLSDINIIAKPNLMEFNLIIIKKGIFLFVIIK